MQQALHHIRTHSSQPDHSKLHFILHPLPWPSIQRFRASGSYWISAPLFDANCIVVSLPAITSNPEERELHRATLIVMYSDISKFNSDSCRSGKRVARRSPFVISPMQPKCVWRLDAQYLPRYHFPDLANGLPDFQVSPPTAFQVSIRHDRDQVENVTICYRTQQPHILSVSPHQRHRRSCRFSEIHFSGSHVRTIPDLLW